MKNYDFNILYSKKVSECKHPSQRINWEERLVLHWNWSLCSLFCRVVDIAWFSCSISTQVINFFPHPLIFFSCIDFPCSTTMDIVKASYLLCRMVVIVRNYFEPSLDKYSVLELNGFNVFRCRQIRKKYKQLRYLDDNCMTSLWRWKGISSYIFV